MRAVFESLEDRNLFSGAPITAPSALIQPAAIVQPLAVLNSVLGTWNGTVSVTGIHDRPVTLKITGQSTSGRLTGVLTTSLDPSIMVAFSGRVKANGAISIALAGSHSGGSIDGTGTGKLSANGKAIRFNMTFTQFGQGFPGSLTLKKGGTAAPPPTTGTGAESEGGDSELGGSHDH